MPGRFINVGGKILVRLNADLPQQLKAPGTRGG
jgi:hypothetical protein